MATVTFLGETLTFLGETVTFLGEDNYLAEHPLGFAVNNKAYRIDVIDADRIIALDNKAYRIDVADGE